MRLEATEPHNFIVKLWLRFVRFGFRLLYYEMAWTYDAVSWLVSLGEWRKWQQAALPFVTGPTVLEIGHGPGHMLVALAEAGYTVTGLDLSPQMGRMARRNGQKAGQSVLLARGKVQEVPFRSGSFTAVLATFPTDYVLDPETLAAVWRVLAENGRFIVIPEGHHTGHGVIHKFISFLFRITGQTAGSQTRDDAFWTNPDLWLPFQTRFAEAGFTFRTEHKKLPKSGVTILIGEKLPKEASGFQIGSIYED